MYGWTSKVKIGRKKELDTPVSTDEIIIEFAVYCSRKSSFIKVFVQPPKEYIC